MHAIAEVITTRCPDCRVDFQVPLGRACARGAVECRRCRREFDPFASLPTPKPSATVRATCEGCQKEIDADLGQVFSGVVLTCHDCKLAIATHCAQDPRSTTMSWQPPAELLRASMPTRARRRSG
jgi:hypothetical protein